MALSNRDRVGKALELLAERSARTSTGACLRRSPMGGNWKADLLRRQRRRGSVRADQRRARQLAAVFRNELRTTGRNLVGELRDWRNKWAHNEPFSHDDAYRALDTIERLLAVIDAPEADRGRRRQERADAPAARSRGEEGDTEARCAVHRSPRPGFGRGGT